MEKLSFTPGTVEDLPLLTEILTDGSQTKLSHGDTVWDDAWTIAEVEAYFKESTPYIVRKDNEIVGTVWMQWEDAIWGDDSAQAGYMHRLVIKDAFRGQGLGAEIIDWAANEVAQNDRQLLRLDCPADNADLCAYYEKLGFSKAGEKFMPEYGYAEALYERPV